MATLSSIRAKVRLRIQEPTADRFSDANLNDLINDAQDEFCLDTEYTKSSWTYTAEKDKKTYKLPSDLLNIERVSFDYLKLQETTLSELDKLDEDLDEDSDDSDKWVNQTGKPTNYVFVTENVIRLSPYPDSDAAGKTIEIYGVQIPEDLTSDSDVSDISAIFERTIADWVAWQVFDMDGETTQAVRYEKKYNKGVGLAIRMKERRIKEDPLFPKANDDFKYNKKVL